MKIVPDRRDGGVSSGGWGGGGAGGLDKNSGNFLKPSLTAVNNKNKKKEERERVGVKTLIILVL